MFASACTSNPTPHPGQDAARAEDTYQGASPETSNEFGPDDDNDGVADCVELNGMWDGETCNTIAPGGDVMDSGDVVEDVGPDGDVFGPDGEDGESGGDAGNSRP